MEDKTTLFSQKAASYLCCFNEHCPKYDNCLRFEVGTYINPDKLVCTCINPRYNKVDDNGCPYFRDNQPCRMPVGMTHFYHDMPQHTALAIKRELFSFSCRATYYKYHRGDRPITPDFLAFIQDTCRRYHWTAPLQFDSEVEDYAW